MKSPLVSRTTVLGTLLALFIFGAGFTTAQASSTAPAVRRTAVNELGQGNILFIGDSLTVGTSAFGQMRDRITALNTWTSVTVDARTGRKASSSFSILNKKISADTTALVIALGTNDMISRSETWYPSWVINQVMSRSRNLPVLWINVKFSPTGRGDWRLRATRFNKRLEQAKEMWPNLYTANWNGFFIPKGGTRFVADGVHLTVKGYKARTTFVIDQLKSFGTSIVMASTTTSSTTTSTSTTSSSTSSSTTTSSTTTSSTTTTVAPSTTSP